MRNIRIKIMSLLAVIATAVILPSCNGDSVPTVTDDNVRVSLSAMQATRAFTYSTDWFTYTDVPTLGIFACIGEGNNITSAIANKQLKVGEATTDWAYSGEQTKVYTYDMLYRGRNHHFFAYGPYDADANVSFDGKKFSWKGVPIASATDRVVINKITDCSRGVATLQMNHLYCKVDVKFNISEKYAELRTIEITDVKIERMPQASFTGTYHCDFSTATPTVSWTDISNSNGNFTWKVAADNSDQFMLPYLDGGVRKYGKVLKSFYIAPGLYNKETFPTIPVTVTYNVYDKDGQETRHQQQVVNNIILNQYSSSGDNGSAVPFSEGGYIYTFNITISPKYLYVLSDNDTESAFNIVIDPE